VELVEEDPPAIDALVLGPVVGDVLDDVVRGCFDDRVVFERPRRLEQVCDDIDAGDVLDVYPGESLGWALPASEV
jgi:hypothetical protein